MILALFPNHLRSFSIQNDNPSFILVDPDSLDERTKEIIRKNLQKFPSAKLLDAKIASQLSKVNHRGTGLDGREICRS